MIKRNLPLMITIGVFVLGYLYCLTQFPGFASTRVICNILTDNAFLGIIAVGMTFVILSGGIDLSVGSVIAFTGVFLAKVIGDFGLSPLLAFPLVLVMGCAFGAFMGLLIDALKIPAFIITLAGMFFLRGVSYLVSEESIPINHPIYDTLSSLAWKIPGGGRLSAMGLLMLAVVVIGIFLAHRTRFGNQVYAIGGNATSANLMGISTRSTTIRIYMLSTGLATLAGIVFSIYTQAGYALAGVGVELDALHRTGNAGGDCLLDLYPGRICAGGRRCGTGCYRLSGNWRYAFERWRWNGIRDAFWRGDSGANSDLYQL